MGLSQEQKERCETAVINAKSVLKKGDRLRVTKCPGTKRTITFERWDGIWIVSKSGINDYHPVRIDLVNGVSVDFTNKS